MKMPIEPMLAHKVEVPADVSRWPLLDREDLAFELKYDGNRLLIDRRPSTVTVLWSRQQRNVTLEFPRTAKLLVDLPEGVYDAEVYAVDDLGRPAISQLYSEARMARERQLHRLKVALFDVLEFKGVEVMKYPYAQRRGLLAEEVGPKLPENVGLSFASVMGRPLWDQVLVQALEGLVAKPLTSVYRPGSRTDWMKLKRTVRRTATVIGWTEAMEGGSLSGRVGALVLGEKVGDGYRYLCKAGAGGTNAEVDALQRTMAPLKRDSAPLTPAEVIRSKSLIGNRPLTWVEPVLTAVIEYSDALDSGTPLFPSVKAVG